MKAKKGKVKILHKKYKITMDKKGKWKTAKLKDSYTYVWKPPTEEEIAAQAKSKRQAEHNKMREIAMFLEGIKHANIGSRIDHEHLQVMWSVVHKMRNEI